MAREFVPRGPFQTFNPDDCKASVHNSHGVGFHQCGYKPKLDGWCSTHHPDAVAERKRKSRERLEAQERERLVRGLRAENRTRLTVLAEVVEACPACGGDGCDSVGVPGAPEEDCLTCSWIRDHIDRLRDEMA